MLNWIVIAIDAFAMGWVLGDFSFGHPLAGAALAILLLLNIAALIVSGEVHVKAAALFCTLVVAIKAMMNEDYYLGLVVWDVQLREMFEPGFKLNQLMFGLIAINAVALILSIYQTMAQSREPEGEDLGAEFETDAGPDSTRISPSQSASERSAGPPGAAPSPGGDSSPPNP